MSNLGRRMIKNIWYPVLWAEVEKNLLLKPVGKAHRVMLSIAITRTFLFCARLKRKGSPNEITLLKNKVRIGSWGWKNGLLGWTEVLISCRSTMLQPKYLRAEVNTSSTRKTLKIEALLLGIKRREVTSQKGRNRPKRLYNHGKKKLPSLWRRHLSRKSANWLNCSQNSWTQPLRPHPSSNPSKPSWALLSTSPLSPSHRSPVTTATSNLQRNYKKCYKAARPSLNSSTQTANPASPITIFHRKYTSNKNRPKKKSGLIDEKRLRNSFRGEVLRKMCLMISLPLQISWLNAGSWLVVLTRSH